jgi:hypothetical protein
VLKENKYLLYNFRLAGVVFGLANTMASLSGFVVPLIMGAITTHVRNVRCVTNF